MSHHFHAVVCIDHAEALILEFSEEGVTEHRIRPKDRHGNIHHKAGSIGSGHAHDGKAYLTAVANALQSVQEILIVGHGTAKNEFASFIRDHAPALAPRIMGVETVAQPTKGEILAHARKFFEAKDRMTPQVATTLA
jgi:stalled ribosome rescue protein Dom34